MSTKPRGSAYSPAPPVGERGTERTADTTAPGPQERARIREQLEAVLASAHFRNSKRYPALLRHLVEHTLAGETAELKERNLGVEVFARDPDFDPSADPVVRMSAAEIRKRLAQYYQEPAHAGELRIGLPLGSYVPEFGEPGADQSEPRKRRLLWLLVAVCGIAAAAAAIVAVRRGETTSALDQFWRPIVSPPGRVMVCVGQAGVPAHVDETGSPVPVRPGIVSWGDALTLGRIGVFLKSYGAEPQFCREDLAKFEDFQQGPALLIGGLNDEWALRLMQNLRFQFRREGNHFYIADRERPLARDWSIVVNYGAEGGKISLEHDYAVISRLANPRTGQMTVMLAGLWSYGTIAASQFLTDPSYLRAMAGTAPSDWARKNLQLVIGTEVIGASPGPPHVLAVTFW
jgi:hypothetical protein